MSCLLECLEVLFPTQKETKNAMDNLKNNNKETPKAKTEYEYNSKDSLMTEIESKYFEVFKEIIKDKFNDNYIIQPQVNLATIIRKEAQSYITRNDLFKNVDFGVFTKDTYSPLFVIEINDNTHLTNQRRIRDIKVKNICDKANIPIVNFWTSYGINRNYIIKQLSIYLK